MGTPTSMESHVGCSSFQPGKLHDEVNKDRDFSQVHLVDLINNSVPATKRKCCWQSKGRQRFMATGLSSERTRFLSQNTHRGLPLLPPSCGAKLPPPAVP